MSGREWKPSETLAWRSQPIIGAPPRVRLRDRRCAWFAAGAVVALIVEALAR